MTRWRRLGPCSFRPLMHDQGVPRPQIAQVQIAARLITSRIARLPPHFVSTSTLIFRLCDEDEDEPLDLGPLACEPASPRPLVAERLAPRGARPCGLDAIARTARALVARADQLVCSARWRAAAVGARDDATRCVASVRPQFGVEVDSQTDDTHTESLDESRVDSETAPVDSGFLFAYGSEDYERAGSPTEGDGAFIPSAARVASRKTRFATPRRILALGGVAAVLLLVVGLVGSHTPQPATGSRPAASTAPARGAVSAAIVVSKLSGRRSVSPSRVVRPRGSRPAPAVTVQRRHSREIDLNPTRGPTVSRPLPHRLRRHEAQPHGAQPSATSSARPSRQVSQHGEPARRADFLYAFRGAAAGQQERHLVSLRPAAATPSVRARPAYIDVDVTGRWRVHRRDAHRPRRDDAGRHRPGHAVVFRHRRRRAAAHRPGRWRVHRRDVRRRGRPRRDHAGCHRPGHAAVQRHRRRRPAAHRPAQVRTKRGAVGGASARKAHERVRGGRRDGTRRRAPVGSLHRRRQRALPARRAEAVGAYGQLQRVAPRALHHRHRSRQER